MAVIKVDQLKGTVPRLDKKKMDEGMAQTAQNARLWSRGLDSYGSPVPSAYPINTESIQTMYRYVDAGREYWLEFLMEVDIRGTPIAQDTRNRVYWTDGIKPKKSSNTLITVAAPYPNSFRFMGVKTPVTAPVYTSGSSGSTETRVYVYTFVTDWGEESAASPALSQDAELADTIVVNIAAEEVPNSLYGITLWRLYKSVTDDNGVGVFLEIAEQDLSNTSFPDDPSLDPSTAITSTIYDEPLDNMKGLVALPNGFFAAFSGREILFSEPFHPHAWPADYRKAVQADVVALGVLGNSLVVTTVENPYIITGVHPETMTQQEIDAKQACVSKKGLVSTQYGVLYPTPDGLYMIKPGGGELITKPLITTVEWNTFQPETMIGEVYDGRYYASHVSAGGGAINEGFIFDPAEPGSYITTHNLDIRVMHQDISEDRLYVLIGGVINRWDADESLQLNYLYKTRVISSDRPMNFSAGQLRGDFSDILTGTALTTYNVTRAAVITDNTFTYISTAIFNFLLHSEGFPSWVITPIGTITVTSNSIVAPDLTTTADTIDDTSAGLPGAVGQARSGILNNNETWTASVYLKEGTASKSGLSMIMSGGSSIEDAATVTWATHVTDLGTLTDVGLGWYRLSFPLTNDTSGNTDIQVKIFPQDPGTPAATGTVYAWGAQLNPGSLTAYVPTTTITGTGDGSLIDTQSVFGAAPLGEIALANDSWRDVSVEADTGITFKLYAGDTLRATKTVTDEKPFRLPTGYLETDFELEVEGRSKIRSMAIATSRSELD